MKEYIMREESYFSVCDNVTYHIVLYMHIDEDDSFYYILREYNDKNEPTMEDMTFENNNLRWAVEMVDNLMMGHDYDDEMLVKWTDFMEGINTIKDFPFTFKNKLNHEVTIEKEGNTYIEYQKIRDDIIVKRMYFPEKYFTEEYL